MFDIGFPELVLIAIVGLLVIGPDRLPEALRTLGLWLGRMRRSFTTVKAEIEKEIGMDEVKRQLHNEAIMEEMKRIEKEVKSTADSARDTLNEGVKAADASAAEASAAEAAAVEEAAASTTDATTAQLPNIDPNVQTDIADAIAAQDQIDPDHAHGSDDRNHSDAANTDDDIPDEVPEPRPAGPSSDTLKEPKDKRVESG